MPGKMDQASQCNNYDLTISIKRQRLHISQHMESLTLNQPSRAVFIVAEVTVRISKDSMSFGGLHANVWDRSGIELYTKLKVYKAIHMGRGQYTNVMQKDSIICT